MDLLPWAAFLGFVVPYAVLDAFDAEGIIAHVLGEMTFYGTTEESPADTLKAVLWLKPHPGREGPGASAL